MRLYYVEESMFNFALRHTNYIVDKCNHVAFISASMCLIHAMPLNTNAQTMRQKHPTQRAQPPPQIAQQAANFIMAGYDTTANALSFTLFELARNPAMQSKVYKECAACPPGLDLDELHAKLTYTHASSPNEISSSTQSLTKSFEKRIREIPTVRNATK